MQTVGSEVSTSLLSAYYPVVLTSASLIVCFWAEVFHLREVRWDRPRFLSKSFLGFLAFNVISYSLLLAEMLLVWSEADTERAFYAHIFNGCYAVLMFVVVIFFLIYGVEVFFKVKILSSICLFFSMYICVFVVQVRGGFTVPRVSHVIAGKAVENERRSQRRRRRQDRRDQELKDAQPKNEHEDQELIATNVVNIEPKNQEENGQSTQPGSSQVFFVIFNRHFQSKHTGCFYVFFFWSRKKTLLQICVKMCTVCSPVKAKFSSSA